MLGALSENRYRLGQETTVMVPVCNPCDLRLSGTGSNQAIHILRTAK